MEQSHQLVFDGTYVKPDGNIKVVFKDPRQHPQVFDFAIMGEKGWSWRLTPETGKQLVVHLRDGSRVEIPEIGILMVYVKPNGEGYNRWRKMEDAAAHVIQVSHHLDRANSKFEEAREAYQKWHGTSF